MSQKPTSPIVCRSPASDAEWRAYFDLRWRILRAPWQQPPGSERDSLENSAFHLFAHDPGGNALACGRLHFNSAVEAQIRYMAVEERARGRGYGATVLQDLEVEAKRRGAQSIVLNSRANAVSFYEKHGYAIVGPAETLFGSIPHVRMAKRVD